MNEEMIKDLKLNIHGVICSVCDRKKRLGRYE